MKYKIPRQSKSSVELGEKFKLEEAIKKYGFAIQSGIRKRGLYAFTVGRANQGKAEIFLSDFAVSVFPGVKEAIERFDAGEFKLGEPFFSKCLHLNAGEHKLALQLVFRERRIDPALEYDMASAVARAGQSKFRALGVIELIFANEHNQLPT